MLVGRGHWNVVGIRFKPIQHRDIQEWSTSPQISKLRYVHLYRTRVFNTGSLYRSRYRIEVHAHVHHKDISCQIHHHSTSLGPSAHILVWRDKTGHVSSLSPWTRPNIQTTVPDGNFQCSILSLTLAIAPSVLGCNT